MSEFVSNRCITSVSSSILTLCGLPVPKEMDEPNPAIMALAKKKLGNEKIDRVVMYNPDAVALWLYTKYMDSFIPAMVESDLAVPLRSVMPSVTPVCFASMYSGLQPEFHGIRKYEKPVLTVRTIFDVFLDAGKKVAIIAENECSIAKIFLNRKMDYFIYPTIEEVNNKARELLKADAYDLLVIYNGNYDHWMHKFGPEAELPLQTLKENVAFYQEIVRFLKDNPKGHRTFYGFCPDHGCHEIDGENGSHGLDCQEDMNVIHFYGIIG